ncbi:RluA family pseudouridine synthase [Paenibacillus thalictri]|uniref:Pseudouridine synthase n=1 Tax=Paenibacillus thalictri TaxID=2527873 RepID=A0A4Q9DPE3_9BACL|nr:RluA family pseudouridine synthase [Paenibacillus thalictri]TBL78175.1 RluA family pseudouridine synthase [Paenibacillus thalictri]
MINEIEQERLEWTADTEDAGERLDKFVVESIEEDVSRTLIQQWIKDGHVTVNGKTVKSNYKIAVGDSVQLVEPPPEQLLIEAEPIPIEVVYEDADVIVVNKPRGMVVHPAPGHYSGTLVNALMYHCQDLSGINGVMRPGIVHRIDKDTSGLLMAAKNDLAHQHLAGLLKDHDVDRKYIAIVHGNLPHDNGTIDAPIGRDLKDRKLYTVTEKNSKRAVTHFVVLERFASGHTLVELKLETGRTHQIRVHMKFIGYPLVGDPAYGRSKGITMDVEGQALHAAVLGFTHPRTREQLRFEAPLPAEMEHLLERLRMQ